MIEILKDYPDDVLAVTGKGRVTAEDYREVLIPEANRRIEKYGTIRLFCHLGADFDGLTAGAAWSDLKLGISRWNQIGRMVVVTDVTWIRDAVYLFAPIFHHPVRTFANKDLEAARAWILEREVAA
ncbi:MAG: STAS/SEC14 domain-containing protein [Hyphomicrobiaceae bacterium]